jgi:hypothetical protein
MSNGQDTALDLYKLEYEQAAERYENIYKSWVWTNFSYLTAVAAGIIAFASKDLSASSTFLLAEIPLLFWFAAVFEPANKYGDQVVDRLSEIETILSRDFRVDLKHYTLYRASRLEGFKWEWPIRVRYAIKIAAGILVVASLVVFILLATKSVSWYKESSNTTTIKFENSEPASVKIVGAIDDDVQKLSQENQQLIREVGELRRSLESISNDLKKDRERGK